ncbi:hypothetical protein ScalyP_jg4218 [Parmales sp. scaly parma]|nr:hypothetical protein ScalyP_jg4218 [Parmales sp. scaly parma]
MWRLISRVSILLQFSACLNLVYIWFVVSLFSSTATTQLKKRAMFAVYALNLIFYSGILLTTRSSGGNKNNTADMMYRINIAILAIVFLLIFSGVTLRGLSLIKLINTLGSTTAVNEKSERALKQITRISAAFLVCFLIRSVMFSFTPITGRVKFDNDLINHILYPWMYYHVPEGVPAMVLFWSFLDKNKVKTFFLSNTNNKDGSTPRIETTQII